VKSPCLLGLETEYAIFGDRPRGNALAELMRQAEFRLRHATSARRRDLFLQNGSRLYLDTGGHPELATPECTSPSELVRYVLAGESILSELLQFMNRSRIGSTRLYRANVDYSGAGTSWGCHESYLHRTDPSRLPDSLIPHLVSRIVYAGAGGFDPLAPGIEFSLSPRVAHLQRAISTDSTYNRGIFHTKNEPLSSRGEHRLHLLCGESLCSHLASWLRAGTTSLVVAMIEGRRHPRGIALKDPLGAMKTFAADPDCRREVPAASGPPLSALAIQRKYLEAAEACLEESFFPDWADDVCREWRAVLARLESDPSELATSLDWPMKRALYTRRLELRGLTWESISRTSGLLSAARRAMDPLTDRFKAWETVLRCQDGASFAWQRLSSHTRCPLGWDELEAFLQFRLELFETEIRFGELGPDGLFTQLDLAGVLSHSAPGVSGVARAVSDPPATGRAKIRGDTIRELGATAELRCDWMHLWDLTGRRVLELSDPFASTASWRTLSECEWESIRGRFDILASL
jgi:proteasome accessory factor A